MRISFIFGVACAVLNAHKTFAYLSIDIHLVAQVLPRLLPGEQIALSQVVFPIVGGAVFLLWEGWYFYCGSHFWQLQASYLAAGNLSGRWLQVTWQGTAGWRCCPPPTGSSRAPANQPCHWLVLSVILFFIINLLFVFGCLINSFNYTCLIVC